MTARPYGETAFNYKLAGWHGVLPAGNGPGEKDPSRGVSPGGSTPICGPMMTSWPDGSRPTATETWLYVSPGT